MKKVKLYLMYIKKAKKISRMFLTFTIKSVSVATEAQYVSSIQANG